MKHHLTQRQIKNLKGLKPNKSFGEISVVELQGVTCHMESHGVTCHTKQVNMPRILTAASKLVLNLPTPEGWKAELT